jgi:hypothetical protein
MLFYPIIQHRRAMLGLRVSQAGLATKSLQALFAPNNTYGLFKPQNEKGDRGGSSRFNAAKP